MSHYLTGGDEATFIRKTLDKSEVLNLIKDLQYFVTHM